MNKIAKTNLSIGLAASLLITTSLSNVAKAQDDDIIVVTATKTEKSIQDVPISVTAVSGDALGELSIVDTFDLSKASPGFNVRTAFGGVPSVTEFSIRGVSQNDAGDHQEAPVAVYADEAYISFIGAGGGQLYDIDRVEILRGPQGTLFGRNATGGLVHIVSNRPTEEFEAYAKLSYGSYNQVISEAAISGPIADKLSARLSFASNHHDGFIENLSGPDRGTANTYNFRGQLLYDIADNAELHLKAYGSIDDDLRTSYTPLTGPIYQVSSDLDGIFSRDYYGALARLNIDFNSISFTSVTDYQNIEKVYSEDFDGMPFLGFHSFANQDSYQFSQELRLSQELERFRWIAGAYLLKIDGEYDQRFDFPLGPGVDFMGEVFWEQDTTSWAIFGQTEYDVTDRVTLVTGLRWTSDDKDSIEGFDCLTPLACVPSYSGIARNFSDGDWAGNFQLNIRPSDNLLLYAGATRGTKIGGFSYSPGFAGFTGVPNPIYDSEVLWNYEAGFKYTSPDNAVRINGSGFYYDYSDYQSFEIPVVGFAVVENVDAEVKGGELEVSYNSDVGLRLSANATYLDTEAKDVTLPFGSGIADQELPGAPEWSVATVASYTFSLFGGSATLQTDYSYVGERFQSVLNASGTLESYSLLGARVAWLSPNDQIEVSVSGTNLLDQEKFLTTFPPAGNPIRPRWFLGTVSVRF